MFNLEEQIKDWRANLEGNRVADVKSLDELEGHLREQFAQLNGLGLTDPERFQVAAGRIGPASAIKQEFAKARHQRLLDYCNASTALNLLGIWFVLMGLSTLYFLSVFSLAGWSQNLGRTMVCLLLSGFQVMIGAGLLQRSNFWRSCALAWAAVFLITCVVALQGAAVHFLFLGFQLPDDFAERISQLSHFRLTVLGTRFADFRHVTDFLSPFILIWGCYFLTRPPVRNLFRPAEQLKRV